MTSPEPAQLSLPLSLLTKALTREVTSIVTKEKKNWKGDANDIPAVVSSVKHYLDTVQAKTTPGLVYDIKIVSKTDLQLTWRCDLHNKNVFSVLTLLLTQL